MSALGYPTTFTYDARDSLTRLTDARGHATTFTYNSLKQLAKQTDPLGRVTTFQYDQVYNLYTRTDPRGVLTTFNYDSDNRHTLSLFPHDPRVTFNFDTVGNRYAVKDGTGITSYVYDANHRVQSVTNSFNRTVTYSYDLRDQRVGMTDPDGGRFTYNTIRICG